MLFYERYGTGEVLLLVHGFLGAHAIFHQAAKLLKNISMSFEFAMRGESKMENNYTVFEYVNVLIRVYTR